MAILDDYPEDTRKAYPVIVGGVRRGLSIAAIGAIVRTSKGLAISNDALRALVNAERSIYGAGERLKFLNLSQTPNPDRLPEALTEMQRQYAFTVRVRGTTKGGAPIERHITISTDTLLTREELQDAALDIAVETGEGSGVSEPDSALLMGGVKAGSKGLL